MAMTPKQERNNIAGQSGDIRDQSPEHVENLSGMIGSSASIAMDRAHQAVDEFFDSPAGAGVHGHTIGSFDWDSGLDIPEQPGEM